MMARLQERLQLLGAQMEDMQLMLRLLLLRSRNYSS